MHTINYPYSFVMNGIAEHLLTIAGIDIRACNATRFLSDRSAENIVWPVYPEIGDHLSIPGEMIFKVSNRWLDLPVFCGQLMVPLSKRYVVVNLLFCRHHSFVRPPAEPFFRPGLHIS